jgi:hypothetical protein
MGIELRNDCQKSIHLKLAIIQRLFSMQFDSMHGYGQDEQDMLYFI